MTEPPFLPQETGGRKAVRCEAKPSGIYALYYELILWEITSNWEEEFEKIGSNYGSS